MISTKFENKSVKLKAFKFPISSLTRLINSRSWTAQRNAYFPNFPDLKTYFTNAIFHHILLTLQIHENFMSKGWLQGSHPGLVRRDLFKSWDSSAGILKTFQTRSASRAASCALLRKHYIISSFLWFQGSLYDKIRSLSVKREFLN